MVNFQNETTITRPRADVVVFTILERRQDVLNAYKTYKEIGLKAGNSDPRKLGVFQASLIVLAEEIRPMLIDSIKTDIDKEYASYQDIKNDIEGVNEDDVIKAWHYIDSLLYSKKFTQADGREIKDRHDIWGNNRRVLGVDGR